MIKAVIFDIGDVLFDEDAQHLWLFHELLLTLRRHGKTVLWDEFRQRIFALASAGPNPQDAIRGALAAFCANEDEKDALWDEAEAHYDMMRQPRPFGMLMNDIFPVLEELQKQYSLAIVANQHPPVTEAIEAYGLRPLFRSVIISEVVDLYKPDPAIFRLALRECGVSAEEAIYIGDRADNDIRPAKALGMKTIRFHRGVLYSHFNPAGDASQADRTITSVSEIAEAVRSIAAERA